VTGIEQSYFLFDQVSECLGGADLLPFLAEIEQDSELIADIEKAVAPVDAFRTKRFENVYDFRFIRLLLYVVTRLRRPTLVLETGVMHGLSSSFILRALDRNAHGRMISIDLPSHHETGPANQDGFLETLPPGKEPGWIVPDHRRGRWDLRMGRSIEVLPVVLGDDDVLDLFFHDSEHTYETMTFEMDFAWERLSPGGILMVDNIDTNGAFEDFCAKVARPPLLLPAPDNRAHDAVRFGLIIR
jgi:predicted O-methyltransferase YrrM